MGESHNNDTTHYQCLGERRGVSEKCFVKVTVNEVHRSKLWFSGAECELGYQADTNGIHVPML